MANLFKSGSTKPEIVRNPPHTGERSKASYRENTEAKQGNSLAEAYSAALFEKDQLAVYEWLS